MIRNEITLTKLSVEKEKLQNKIAEVVEIAIYEFEKSTAISVKNIDLKQVDGKVEISVELNLDL